MLGWCGQARVLRGAWVCVLSLKLFGLSGVVSFLCVVRASPQGVVFKSPLISEWVVSRAPRRISNHGLVVGVFALAS